MNNYLPLLQTTTLFAGLSAAELSTLLSRLGGSVRSYGKGEALVLAGEPSRRVGIVLSGELEDTGEKLRDGRHRPAAVYRYNPDRSRASTAPPVGPPRDAPTIEELEDQRIEDALSALMPSARA